MPERRHEKLGWTLGWIGGFVWVLILSVVFLIRGDVLQATLGAVLTAAACVAIIGLSPWRHPRTRYRGLMAPIYVLFFTAVAWGVWAVGDVRQLGINSPWALLALLPVMTPLWTVGSRRWEDSDV
jgi:hypothetical protein